MEKWIQDQIKELESLNEPEIRKRMRLLKYGPPTSPRHDVVKNYLNHLPKPPIPVVSIGKSAKRVLEIVFLGVAATLLGWLILHFLGFA